MEHELSHIFFALLSGARIKSISLKNSNAYVKTEKVNIFIALAPYSLPLYTLLTIFLYKILRLFLPSVFLEVLFYFLFGMTLSFHFIATVHYLQLDQPDMQRYGFFASLMLIITWSIVILSLIISLLFRDLQLLAFYRAAIIETKGIYAKLFMILSKVVSSLQG